MQQIEMQRQIYDETGLIKIETFMSEPPITLEEQIARKEQKLIEIYEEIQKMKIEQNS